MKKTNKIGKPVYICVCSQWIFGEIVTCDVTRSSVLAFVSSVRSPLTSSSLVDHNGWSRQCSVSSACTIHTSILVQQLNDKVTASNHTWTDLTYLYICSFYQIFFLAPYFKMDKMKNRRTYKKHVYLKKKNVSNI